MDIGIGRTAVEGVREAVAAFSAAATSRDAAGLASLYAEDAVSCDAIGEMRYVGRDAIVAHWQACWGMCPDSTIEMRDLRVEASGEVGFCHFLLACAGVGPDGVRHEGLLRGTSCLRREEGRWVIAHDHCSVPFDPMTGKVLGMPG